MERQPGRLTLSEGDRRVLALWAADCAERVLLLFEAKAPEDTRAREAIDGLRGFARGEVRIGAMRALSARAHAAAREAGDPAATAAARAAGQAAAVAHMAAHSRSAVAYAVLAAELADSSDLAARAELDWQLGRASHSVREALLRLPAPTRSGGALGTTIAALHSEIKAAHEAPDPAP